MRTTDPGDAARIELQLPECFGRLLCLAILCAGALYAEKDGIKPPM
jgi:hypothetical protein